MDPDLFESTRVATTFAAMRRKVEGEINHATKCGGLTESPRKYVRYVTKLAAITAAINAAEDLARSQNVQ